MCPAVDIGSSEGDCGSTCVGQLGLQQSCKDYEQYRAGTNDRRCRVRAELQCVRLGEALPQNLGNAVWVAGPWSAWGQNYNDTCTTTMCSPGEGGSCTTSAPYACVKQDRTRTVICRDSISNQVRPDADCSVGRDFGWLGGFKPHAIESRVVSGSPIPTGGGGQDW